MSIEGKLIIFEGGEFVGKSTQIKLLAERLRECGIDAVVSKEPGGTEKGKEIRKRLLYGQLSPEKELGLFLKDREIHFQEKVLPALEKGKWVLIDRCSLSTIAYQHCARGLDLEGILKRDACARKNRDFDLIILLDMEPKLAMQRVGIETRFEKEPLEFHKRVREGFLEQAKNNLLGSWLVLDASNSIQEISGKIWQEVQKRFL